MKQGILLILMILFISFNCCKKNEEQNPEERPEGCINLSEVTTETDYYLPFAIASDNSGISAAKLNGEEVSFSEGDYLKFDETGFYELIIYYREPGKNNDTILFTTKIEEREAAEWGIREWVPESFEGVVPSAAVIDAVYPRHFADSIDVPFVFYVTDPASGKPVYSEAMCPSIGTSFNIKQGVGSVSVTAAAITSQIRFTVGSRQIIAALTKLVGPAVEIKGTIRNHIEIAANSLVRIKGNVDILSTGSLTVNEGAIVLVDEAVDINISGPVKFTGTAENPILVTCSKRGMYWGGFITRVAGGTVEAQYTIFSRSGYHDTSGYFWGHAGRQALFYTENSTLTLSHCFMTDHIGQIFYPISSTLNLSNILVQRAKTGGQLNYSVLTLKNSVFTDFPDDSFEYLDQDNDALYLSGTDAQIENTIFMYAKDDGLDSGDSQGGTVNVTGCRFEACFHEGAALSSANDAVKNHTFTSCVFTNCGQGIELGYSSPNHLVIADNCTFLKNGIGIRYGDNYQWADVEGKMIIKNSLSLNNDKDVWNMVRKSWSPELENLEFENTKISKFSPQYPDLEIMQK
jgi:hypothetical protein